MEYKQIIGAKGEEKACKYLKMKGYQIMEKNYRCKLGEIDIIAKDKNKEIVFIEVKTRSNLKYGNPAEAVNSGKQIHIKKVASYFLLKNRLYKQPVRFDIIEILLGKTCWLHHIRQAFQ